MKQVLLLCDGGMSSRIVAQALAKENILSRIIIAQKQPLAKRLKWRVRRLGLVRVGSQLMVAALSRILFALKKGATRRTEILTNMGVSTEWPKNIPRTVVSGVNNEDCLAALQSNSPDIVVVNGTDIIKSHILNGISAPFYNTHCGLTPDYRGVHGAFWALWEGRPDRMGVTIHRVDQGVDTGEIVAQATISYNRSKDGLSILPLLQYQAAIPLLLKFLSTNQLLGPIPGSDKSKQWYYPGISSYLQLIWQRKIPH